MNKPRIVKDTDSGEWYGIIGDDCVVTDKSPEYVAGYLAAYEKYLECLQEDVT